MAVLRQSILTSPDAQRFFVGAAWLSNQLTDLTPNDLNARVPNEARPRAVIAGNPAAMSRQVSWWDLLAWWHLVAMAQSTGSGNRAHRGPVFLPWHRLFLRRLEEWMQIIWADDTFALPYWDWAADGELPIVAGPGVQVTQSSAPLWSDALAGESQGVVTTGPVGDLRIRLWENIGTGALQAVAPRRIFRESGLRGLPMLPTRQEEQETLDDDLYDEPEWDDDTVTFRNKLEGFEPSAGEATRGAYMHNQVHVWVGGDMLPGTSPNDPVFWLNHCNVDRLWEGWMIDNGRQYAPGPGEGPPFHRSNSPLYSIFAGGSMTPVQILDPTAPGLDWYTYG
ncbi:MAG: tyrosinase family protein [Acidimicrobiia bacterium]|nr:tyrosinase family protein [Acidimicrobiia bacterium]